MASASRGPTLATDFRLLGKKEGVTAGGLSGRMERKERTWSFSVDFSLKLFVLFSGRASMEDEEGHGISGSLA